MWLLKSSINGQSVDAQTFFYEMLGEELDFGDAQEVLFLYEKLTYQCHLDEAFRIVTALFGLPPLKLFTDNRALVPEGDTNNFEFPPIERFYNFEKNIADLVNGTPPGRFFKPDVTEKEFLKTAAKSIEGASGKTKKTVQKEIAARLKKIQFGIAHTIFARMDETGGFTEFYMLVSKIVSDSHKSENLQNTNKTMLANILKECKKIEKEIDVIQISVSEIFRVLSDLYTGMPDKIKKKDLHWKKLYMFALYPALFDMIEALSKICNPKGKPYITDHGATYGWNGTWGTLTELIQRRLKIELSGKKQWEPFQIAFDKTTLEDDAEHFILNAKNRARIEQIERKIEEYVYNKKIKFPSNQ
ncbi:MAG: hypothetical protein LBS97_00635 [Treponema sp.]|jgi:hypothetical protein|nr:hypothetical protein [Treponema sp.]